MSTIRPLNFQKWINEHRDLLKPPVGNKPAMQVPMALGVQSLLAENSMLLNFLDQLHRR